MKKILITTFALSLAVPALAAQQDIAQISAVTASREALRTAINTQLSAVQANFDEVYAVIEAGPVYVNASAPADTKVVWIDTDQSNAIKVYVGGVWTVVGGGGSYTLPTAAADTLGGVKVGDRLSIADGVLSADIQTTDISGKENSLGNPSVTGYVLSSTTAGVRSWIEMTGGGTGIAHAPSDGNYYASLNGAWASLTGRYADALEADDYYVTSEEKTRLGEIGATDSPSFAGVNVGAPLTTNGLVNFYGNTKLHPFSLWSAGADAGSIGWQLPSSLPSVSSLVTVDIGGTVSYTDPATLGGDDLGSAAYSDVVALWTTCTGYLKSDGTCDTPSGSATYPSAAGVANWDGSAWGTSYTVGTGASNLVQLNASAQLPAVSGALLTNIPMPAWLPASAPTADNMIIQATGGCSDTAYTDQATCEANSGTWTTLVGAWTNIIDGLINDAGTGTDDLLSASEINTRISSATAFYQVADGDLDIAAGASAAGNSKLFGTNSSGTPGWYDIPVDTDTDDQTAAEVGFTPNGSIAATDTQAAVQEVRDEAEMRAPLTLNLTTDTSVTAQQLLDNKYISNQGAAGEVDITLPAISYSITRTVLITEEQIVEINPPSGEAFDLSGTALDANDCIDSPATVGAKAVFTRMQNASGTWFWSVDTVRGDWVDTGASD